MAAVERWPLVEVPLKIKRLKCTRRMRITGTVTVRGNEAYKLFGYHHLTLFSFYTVSCPTGWLEFNYSCFKKFENSKFWHSAQEACKNLNGSLASIHSSEENQFLYAQLFSNSRLWIGFNDINREGVFEWIDNSYVSFTDWESDEPNDYRNNEDCAAMQAIQWGDYPCRDTYHYLCRIIYE